MTDRDLIGEKVVSPIYGEGNVTDVNKEIKKLTIEFIKEGKRTLGFRQFSEKETNRPSHFINPEAQKYILKNLLEETAIGVPIRETFFVFQGITFDEEFEREYLYASKSSDSSRWEMMKNVHRGDIVFHCDKGYIRGISQALGQADVVPMPAWLKKYPKWRWSKYAWAVGLESYFIKSPTQIEDLNDIVGYCCNNTKISDPPFDRYGKAKYGYLFKNPSLLSFILLDYILNDNVYLYKVQFIKDIWEQLNSDTKLVKEKAETLQKFRSRRIV